MNLTRIIKYYKQKRKEKLISSQTQSYIGRYAVVGVGQHSLSTLYPVLSYLHVPLKYIVTQRSDLNKQLAPLFPGTAATKNYDLVLQDPEVAGIFICANPASHYELASKALQNRKNIFIEKPICYSLADFNKLIDICQTHCIVGLQKRYSTAHEILQKKIKSPIYYHGRYATGSYPEGNPVYELFIHPIDNVIALFGNAKINYLKKIKTANGLLITLHIEHTSGVHGIMELSTNHHWTAPVDTLRIELKDAELFVSYPGYIESVRKQTNILSIPVDKVFQIPIEKKIIYNNKNFAHTIERNILYEAGYYGEIKKFVTAVENKEKIGTAPTSLQNLTATYQLLEAINF